MTYGQLALIRYVLEQVKEGKKPSISNSQKVDLDDMGNYFDNLVTDIKKNKKIGKVKDGEAIAYRLLVEVNK